MKKIIIILGVIAAMSAASHAQKLEKIQLNPPELSKGKLLMQALKERKSGRAYSSRELPLQELSNLLWAAFGINRPDDGKRTAPSAMNRQEIDLYVMLKGGIYLYDAKSEVLMPVVAGDHRELAGMQEYSATAPVNIFMVSDLEKMKGEKKMQEMFSGMNAGYISQNIYLYCASAGLSTVARGSVKKEQLAVLLKLLPGQEILLAQSVGYPAEPKKEEVLKK